MRLSKQSPHRNVPICITGERLLFTQPDMHHTNFGVDEHGKTVLLDFGEIAFLPESFARFTLSSGGFATIIESLGLSGKSNMAVMRNISYFLGMVSNPKLGASAYAWHGTTTNVRHRYKGGRFSRGRRKLGDGDRPRCMYTGDLQAKPSKQTILLAIELERVTNLGI